MRRLDRSKNPRGFRLRDLVNLKRRQLWFLDNLNGSRAANLLSATAHYALKRETLRSLPAVLKIDISPLCNLACTVCVHADPAEHPSLPTQRFEPGQRMSLDGFRRIVEEVRGKTSTASLYYLGDPLMHPDLDDMCGIARTGGLNVHVSTNFSFQLSNARIRSLTASGITHLTVCLDGMTQSTYGPSRVKGSVELVKSNLRRLCEQRRTAGVERLKIEVQFLKFQHNLHEEAHARSFAAALGVDQFCASWGDVHNYADIDVGRYEVHAPRPPELLPHCMWPWFGMVIKYNGDAIPCCEHRLSTQYASNGSSAALGNVLREGVREVWNSDAYRRARRLTADPELAGRHPDLQDHFCQGCSRVFETERAKAWRSGSQHAHARAALPVIGR